MIHLARWRILFAVFVFCLATTNTSLAQEFKTLVSFTENNGANPSLIQGTDGNFYGTQPNGGGTVITVTPTGTVEVVLLFDGFNGADGWNPSAGLVLGTDGNFYGTTSGGADPYRNGTVFRMTPSAKITTLHGFCIRAACVDGSAPLAPMIQGMDGAFYGTTSIGGGKACGSGVGCGTIFKINREGRFTILHRFGVGDAEDGGFLEVSLIQTSDGTLFGTTTGGAYSNTRGTVFKMTPAGHLTTLHTFCSHPNCADGEFPLVLIHAIDGGFYGVTQQGGIIKDRRSASMGSGTVYKITREGYVRTLHTFDGTHGGAPSALTQATDGNLYGAASIGGTLNYGTLFRITPDGQFTTLHEFCRNGPPNSPFDCKLDGAYPTELFQATDGNIYGTTNQGGSSGSGTFFRLDMGLAPFVAFVRPFGKVGDTEGILGQGFTGTTSVTLNGTPANFTVVSDTFIKATVPEGGASGYLTVTTPSGALTSNVPFRVLP
jgi:uncharacterized repeat protein (TIGR03803 family)